MSTKISKELRKKIHDDPRTVREIAAELGLSPTSVQKWKQRVTFDDEPVNRKGRIGKEPSERAAFRELMRLSRYNGPKLFEYLAPIWPSMPTKSKNNKALAWNEDVGGGGNNWSRATFYRAVKGFKVKDKKPPAPGDVVTHRIRVVWTEGGRQVKGDVLLFMERYSGLVFAKILKDKLTLRSFAVCLARFDAMLPYAIKSLVFVMSNHMVGGIEGVKSTALLLDSGKIGNELKQKLRTMSDNSMEILQDVLTFDFDIYADETTQHQEVRLKIYGEYNHKKNLDRALENILNKINLTPRTYLMRGVSVEMCPIERIIEVYRNVYNKGAKLFYGDKEIINGKNKISFITKYQKETSDFLQLGRVVMPEDDIKRRIKLPRRWSYEYSSES